MNSKEAIEFLNENILDFKERTEDEELFNKNECEKFIKKAEEVVLLLKRGEKFEKIFNEIEAESHIGTWWEDYIKGKVQKYFPKEKEEKLPECFETDGIDNIEYDPYFCCINGKWRIVEVYKGEPISEIKVGGTD